MGNEQFASLGSNTNAASAVQNKAGRTSNVFRVSDRSTRTGTSISQGGNCSPERGHGEVPMSSPSTGSPATIMSDDGGHHSRLASFSSICSDEFDMMEPDNDQRFPLDFSRIPEDHPYLFRPISENQDHLNRPKFGVDRGFVLDSQRTFRTRRRRPELVAGPSG